MGNLQASCWGHLGKWLLASLSARRLLYMVVTAQELLSYYADANPKNLYKRTELPKVNDVFDHLKSRPSLVECTYFHFTSPLVIDTQISTHIYSQIYFYITGQQ